MFRKCLDVLKPGVKVPQSARICQDNTSVWTISGLIRCTGNGVHVNCIILLEIL